MKNLLKRIGLLLGIRIAVVLLASAGIVRGSALLTADYEYQLAQITISTNSESIANGEYLAIGLLACSGCHGADMGGQILVDEAGFMVVYAPNLARGEGGTACHTEENWSRALRHGIRPNGESLMVIPSQFLSQVSTDDLGDITAYVQSLPLVDNLVPKREVGLPARLLMGLGLMPEATIYELLPATGIDHHASPP